MRSLPRLVLMSAAPFLVLALSSAGAAQHTSDFAPARVGACEPTAGPVFSMVGRSGRNCAGVARALAAGSGKSTSGAIGTFAIIGNVTDSGSGEPLANVCVITQDGTTGFTGTAKTDAEGRYRVEQAPVGFHKVWFQDCGGEGYYQPEWYEDHATYDDASSVFVGAGGVSANAALSLSEGRGAVTGVAADAADGTPIPNVCASVIDERGHLAALAIGDSGGTFAAEGLEPGQYNLLFAPCTNDTNYSYEWYANQETIDPAQEIAVRAGESTRVDAALARGSSIAGEVTLGGKTLLEGICVASYSEAGFLTGSSITNNDGRYMISGLRSGAHFLFFEDCRSPFYQRSEWYQNAESFEDATAVQVGDAGSEAIANASLTSGGEIIGIVSDEDGGQVLSSICVDVLDLENNLIGSTVTGAGGLYRAGGLPSNFYRLWFRDCRQSPKYATNWTTASAQPNHTRDFVDVTLSEGGLINGTITAAGAPLWGACVFTYDLARALTGIRRTDRLGEYTVSLASGTYRVAFVDCSVEETYHPEWYNDEPIFELADNVPVGAAGTKRSNINATLARLILGDAGCDGAVNSIDAALVLQTTAALFVAPCLFNADVDEDVIITSIDAALILQYVAGLLEEL